MKNLLWGLAIILLLVGCSEDTPTSSSCTGVVTTERSISFKLNGVLFDLEKMEGFRTVSFSRNFNGSTEFEVTTESFADSSTNLVHISLKLDWDGINNGAHTWENKFTDSSSYGCTIVIDSLAIEKRSVYRSISGQTSIKTYTSPNLDSLFGRFCGQVKDSFGNVSEISEGKFYEASN